MFILLALLSVYCSHAEEPKTEILDSILLDEIVTYGDYVKYQPGAKIVTLRWQEIENAGNAGLDQLISRYTPIYIKSDAGGLSTIRIRGTAPDHTTINFGGININSLTLGHSNMSAIPTFLFDRFELQYGGSSALNGSGAIGGAIYLGQQNQWTKGVKTDLKITQGSFGEHLYGTKIFMGNGKFESVTRLYIYEKENDFTFKNPYHLNRIENRAPIDDIQHGASIKNKGLLQEFNYLFSPNEFIKSSIWLDQNWHQVQPNMQTNFIYTSTEELYNNNIRTWAEYKNENHDLKYKFGAGYVHDYQLYNNDENQEIITDRVIGEASLKHSISKKMEYKMGAKYKYIVPEVYSYSKAVIENEQHLDLFLSWFYQPIKRLKTTLNIRQMLVSNFKAPFTPALGAEYQILSKENSLLSSSLNISRSFRIPTFNDRFWGSQGNPNLKPEDGINLEAGVKYYFCNGENHTTLKLDAFYMDIDNWIEWRNFGGWQAQNIQRVVSKGIELHANTYFTIGAFISDVSMNYTLNSTEAIKTSTTSDPVHHQLIYTPLHMGNVSYLLHYKNLLFYIDGSFTGERYAVYHGAKLQAYFLTNCGATYKFSLKKQDFKIALSANNIFNVSYENEKYYAMPGANFKASISTTLKLLNQNL